jgi:hypothetical protein
MHTHVHLCSKCGLAWDHDSPQDCLKPGTWGTCEACVFKAQTDAFDQSVLADQKRIEHDRRLLQLASKSTRKIDSGRVPIGDSPLFGGPAQGMLF